MFIVSFHQEGDTTNSHQSEQQNAILWKWQHNDKIQVLRKVPSINWNIVHNKEIVPVCSLPYNSM